MNEDLRGPYTFIQQWLKIYTYFPNNPFSKTIGRLAYTWDSNGKKQRWIAVSPLNKETK